MPDTSLRSKALELAFDKISLRQLCENEVRAKRELGDRVAKKLKTRLADLRAAACVNDLEAGQPSELNGAGNGLFTLQLTGGYRVIFCANHNSVPTIEAGRIDWSHVNRVKILEIKHD